MYQPIQAGRLYEKIVEQIEQQILDGHLTAGDQLPPERDLAERFGVSRTAVREAVRTLTQKGLVEVLPGRGTFVADDVSRALRHSLDLMVKIGRMASPGSLVELREILEPEIAAMAATRASEEHIATMRAAVEAMDVALQGMLVEPIGSVKHTEAADAYIEADLDFHLALAEATYNPLIPTLIDSIVDLLRDQRKRLASVEGGGERGQYHHRIILQTVAERDPDAARETMKAHLRQIRADNEASRGTAS